MAKIIFDKKIYGLAPMAGFTDSAFRLTCKEFGADLVYTELISARGIVEDKKLLDGGKSLRLARFDAKERPVFVQIFGSEPDIMAEATEIIIDKLNPEGIDINMGCPAPKVVKNAYGSALMRNPEAASKIIKAVRKVSGDKLVSVKTRLGWSKDDEILKFGPILEEAGCQMLAVHARTKEQGFAGDPNWKILGELKNLLSIPLLANGGVKNWQDADVCLKETGADGILIGQEAIGRPWIFEEVKKNTSIIKNFDEIIFIAEKHLALFDETGLDFCEIRKHLMQYFKGFENAARIREKICLVNSREEFLSIVKKEKILKG